MQFKWFSDIIIVFYVTDFVLAFSFKQRLHVLDSAGEPAAAAVITGSSGACSREREAVSVTKRPWQMPGKPETASVRPVRQGVWTSSHKARP